MITAGFDGSIWPLCCLFELMFLSQTTVLQSCQYFFLGWTRTEQRILCLAQTQHSASGEAPTVNSSISSWVLYQWATVEYSTNEPLCPIVAWSWFTLNAPIATKVVCFSRLLQCLRSLYSEQCGPRSDCSYRSSLFSLFWVQAVCFYT